MCLSYDADKIVEGLIDMDPVFSTGLDVLDLQGREDRGEGGGEGEGGRGREGEREREGERVGREGGRKAV